MVLNKVPPTLSRTQRVPGCSDGKVGLFLRGYPAIERTDIPWHFTPPCAAIITVRKATGTTAGDDAEVSSLFAFSVPPLI